MNDVRKMIYGSIIAFFLVLSVWFSIIYVSSCGFSFTCNQAAPLVIRTPIPTLIPAARSAPQMMVNPSEFNKCKASATDLIAGWVSTGSSESEPFSFTDVNGQPCEGTFAVDIQPLFVENSLWYPGAIGCVSCHNSELSERSAGLDLSSYDAILKGTRRVAGSTSPGTDILGGGDLEKSLLYKVLINQGLVPEGHSTETPANELIVYAGQPVADVSITPTP